MHFFSFYADYLPCFIGAALFFVLALVLWQLSRRALANSRGGTEWVREYRASGFDFTKQRLTAPRHDWLCLFGVIVFTLLFSAGVLLLRGYSESGSWLARFLRPKTACKLVIFAAGAFSVCWLLMDLFKNNTLAVCGSILFGVSFVGHHAPMALVCCSLLLLLRWFVSDDDAPLFPGVLLLLAADILLAVAASRSIGLAYLAVVYFVLHICKSIRRQSAGAPIWQLFVMPLCGLIVWAVAFYAGRIAMMYIGGMISLTNVSKLLSVQYFGREMLRLVSLPTMIFRGQLSKGMLLFPLTDAPLLAAGFFGFFVAVRTASERHDPAALASAAVLAVLALVWLFRRDYCVLPGLLLCTVCLFRRFTAAETSWPAVTYTVLACIYYAAIIVLTYLMKLPSALAGVLL